MRFEPPTSAANANLKASSRAQPAGVRHPLTSLLPFHLRSDLLHPFSGNGTSEEPTTQVRQNGSMNSHEKRARSAALRRFTANPPRPVHKTPPPFSHTVPQPPSWFSSSCLLFLLEPHAKCAIARPGASSRFRRSSNQRKRPHPQVLNILSHHEVFHPSSAVRLHKISDLSDFRIRGREKCVCLSLIGGCAVPSVSFADLPRFLTFSSG